MVFKDRQELRKRVREDQSTKLNNIRNFSKEGYHENQINSSHLFIPSEVTGSNMHVPIILCEASCFLNTCSVSLVVPAIRFVDTRDSLGETYYCSWLPISQ